MRALRHVDVLNAAERALGAGGTRALVRIIDRVVRVAESRYERGSLPLNGGLPAARAQGHWVPCATVERPVS